MNNIIKDPYRENSIIYRKKEKFKSILDNVDVSNVENTIKNIINEKQDTYIFKFGDRAELIDSSSVINSMFFNPLQIYSFEIRNIFNLIKKMLAELCKQYDINIEKNMYFISSEYENELLNNYIYDTGGIRIPCFSGYCFLNCKDDSYIKIENKKIEISNGSIILFESGHKIKFNNVESAISFNISPISMLAGQYPQKWMPV